MPPDGLHQGMPGGYFPVSINKQIYLVVVSPVSLLKVVLYLEFGWFNQIFVFRLNLILFVACTFGIAVVAVVISVEGISYIV